VSDALGTRDFLRLRFGVGRPVQGQSMGRFVLGRFTETEQEQYPELLNRCTAALETLMTSGLDKAQTALHSAPVSRVSSAVQ
jgi:PTH1 family peptidyl-tRNA hydrolase